MNIISKKLASVVIENGQEVSFNLANWPEKSPGQPYRKSECLWDGSKVVLKTQAQLESDAAPNELEKLDKYMPRPTEQQYDLLIATDKLTANDLADIQIDENTTLLDIYNQKKTLRSQLAS